MTDKPNAAPAPDAKEENLATMARIGALRCEGGPHSPTGFLLRQLADAFDSLTAAPAPEPNHWKTAALRLGEELASVGPENYYKLNAYEWLHWALSVVHIKPAAPAPDVPYAVWRQGFDAVAKWKETTVPDADAIMALADTVAFRCDRYGINHAGQARELLRAAVEQLVRERDELRALLVEAHPYVGMVRSNDIAGDDPIFALLARIDALLKGPSQEGLSTTKESQHGEGQEGR